MPSINNEQNPQKSSKSKTNESGSKKIILIFGIILVIIVSFLITVNTGVIATPAWLSKIMPDSMTPEANPLMGTSKEEAKLASMLESGKPGVCSINSKTGEAQIKYYISGDKFKIEAINTEDEKTVTSYIISDGEYQYLWTDLSNQGTKMKLPSQEDLEEMEQEAEELANQYEDEWSFSDIQDDLENDEEQYEVNCKYQNVSANTFDIPTDIEFVEFGDMSNFTFNGDANNEEIDFNAEDFEMEDINMEDLEKWSQEMQEAYGDE